jgi:lysophospholipase L1-like esterase
VDVLPRLAALGAALLLAACSASGDEPAARRTASPPAATPSTTPTATPAVPDPTYVALGDSVAAGTGAQDPAREGYVPVLAGLVGDQRGCDDGPRDGCPVRVRNLAVPGATTATLLRDQLPQALPLLREGDVRTVTVTIGGNDVFVPILRACAQEPQSATCTQAVRAAIGEVDRGVDRLLTELTAAGGPAATVAVMTYYDPLSACRLAPLQPLAQLVLEGRPGEDGLNDVLRARAAEHGAVVVETGGRLAAPQDFVGGLDCLHPSTSGHARIAAAFAEVLPQRAD